MEITALLISIVAGIFIGLPTGPARFFVADSFLNNGKNSALKVYSGLFTAIVIYAGIAFLAAGFFSRHKEVEVFTYLLGSVLIISWGIFMVVKSNNKKFSSMEVAGTSGFKKGFLTALSNPVTPFIYLALIQVLKWNSGSESMMGILIYLLFFELAGFWTTFGISYFIRLHQKEMKANWKRAKLILGFFLIFIGFLNLYQLIEFQNGIKIQKEQNIPEQHIKL